MVEISREQLHAYLDDALSDVESARIERAVRDSAVLQNTLRIILQERDRGDHSIGAIWRRNRLTCATREQLGSYLLQVLDDDFQAYLRFHLEEIGCAFCNANLVDLQTAQQESSRAVKARRRRLYASSAAHLQVCREAKR
jgi:hypothetical protein